MINTNVNYILVGPCGAGKNTVMEFFKDAGLTPISATDHLRGAMQKDTPEGAFIRHCGETGESIPDDVIFSIVKPALQASSDRGFVMESFPYNLAQWSYLKDWLSSLGPLAKKVVFVYLKINRETLLERLSGRLTCPSCNRVYHVTYQPPHKPGLCDICNGVLIVRPWDINPETIQKRLLRFEKETMPVLDAIKGLYPLLIIDRNRHWTAEEFGQELNRQLSGT
jgi:adenylate kinase